MMISQDDKMQLQNKGVSEIQLEEELKNFVEGFPFLKLYAAASAGEGILCLDEDMRTLAIGVWEKYCKEDHKIMKFVPASGAASRMFKNLFAFLDASYDTPQTEFERIFFDHLKSFAFYDLLTEACQHKIKMSLEKMMETGRYKDIVETLLSSDGLNYGQKPKGLLLFHRGMEGTRTPVEEHMAEGAFYAAGADNTAHVHFTVSREHRSLFKTLLDEKIALLSEKYKIKYDISLSEQKPSTDTVAVTPDNEIFREDNGQMLFRPGGHGSLIENLNDLDADIVFIKNIDNVVPDGKKSETVHYKKTLAGILVDLQEKVFAALQRLDTRSCSCEELQGYLHFLETDLCCINPVAHKFDTAQIGMYLHKKFNRPFRVCAMVKNVGEPGGGPFWVYNKDGSVSCQILESSQVNQEDAIAVKMFKEGTYFNPVDLVCGLKNYRGEKFNLLKYVDKTTGFISQKSKNGRELRALERPGLWNGAMSDWNTVFVEVPLSTFNPVKTVNDLLREQHM